MKKDVGLWIDDREAILVIIINGAEEIKHIPSGVGRHINYSGYSHMTTSEWPRQDYQRSKVDEKPIMSPSSYYDEVAASLLNADSIQIFGPGAAKSELTTRLEKAGLKEHLLEIETTGRMTYIQILAKVRECFPSEAD